MTFKSLVAAVLAAAVFAAQAGQIVVGQVAPLSGIEAPQGRAYAAGMRLYFSALNRGGGIAGHTFELVSVDDEGRPDRTVPLTQQLLAEHKPLVLAGYFGAQGVGALLDSGLLERSRTALVGYRQSGLPTDAPMLFSVRATLDDEIRKFVEHLATVGVKRLALLHEDGPGAPQLRSQAREMAAAGGASLVATASYPAGSTRVRPAVEAMLKAAPQAVILVAGGAAAAAFIEQYRGAGGTAQIFASSSVDIEQLARRLGEEQMQGVAIAQVTPNPYKVSNRLTKEFNDMLGAAGQPLVPSYAMMEGFITAKVITEAVRRQGPQLRRDAFLRSLERLGDIDLGGYAVGFSPQRRAGSRWVELTIVTAGGRIRQ